MEHEDREATNSKMKQGTHVKQETEKPYGRNKGIMYRWNKKTEKQSTVRRNKKRAEGTIRQKVSLQKEETSRSRDKTSRLNEVRRSLQ